MTGPGSLQHALTAAGQPEHDPGYEGLLLAGYTPQQAYQQVTEVSITPDVQAIIASLRETPEGRMALEYSRAQWAARGWPPPWDLGPGTR